MSNPISYETVRHPTWFPIGNRPPFIWVIRWHTTKASGWIVQHIKIEVAVGSAPYGVTYDYWETWRINGHDSIDTQDGPRDFWTMDLGPGAYVWRKIGDAYWVPSLPDTFLRGRHPGVGNLAWCGRVANIQLYGTRWIRRVAAGQVNVLYPAQVSGPFSIAHPNHVRVELQEIRS